MPYSDGAFDLVSALEVLEHLPCGVYERALQEIDRVARCHILLSVPYRETTRRVKCPYCGCTFHPTYHMRRLDEAVLGKLFRSFDLIRSVKLRVTDYVFGEQFGFAFRRLFNRRELYPYGCLCPQCGYQEANSDGGDTQPLPRMRLAVRRVVQMIVPRRKRALWIVALYERRS